MLMALVIEQRLKGSGLWKPKCHPAAASRQLYFRIFFDFTRHACTMFCTISYVIIKFHAVTIALKLSLKLFQLGHLKRK